MKAAVIALILSAAQATNHGAMPLSVTFPTACSSSSCSSTALCCDFVDNQSNQDYRCITDSYRNGAYTGTYEDDQYSVFTWTCPQPEEPDNTTDTNTGGGDGGDGGGDGGESGAMALSSTLLCAIALTSVSLYA